MLNNVSANTQRTALALLLAASFLALPANSLLAQSDTSDLYQDRYSQQDLKELSEDIYDILSIIRVDLDVDGSALSDIVHYLQEQSPIHLNIVVHPEIQDVVVPSIALKNVTVIGALNAVTIALSHSIELDSDDTDEILSITRAAGYVPSSDVMVFNLKDVLKNTSQESFLSAVEIGIDMMGGSNADIKLKLHEETKVLFVKGSDQEIGLISNLVKEISGTGGGLTYGDLLGGGGGSSLMDGLLQNSMGGENPSDGRPRGGGPAGIGGGGGSNSFGGAGRPGAGNNKGGK